MYGSSIYTHLRSTICARWLRNCLRLWRWSSECWWHRRTPLLALSWQNTTSSPQPATDATTPPDDKYDILQLWVGSEFCIDNGELKSVYLLLQFHSLTFVDVNFFPWCRWIVWHALAYSVDTTWFVHLVYSFGTVLVPFKYRSSTVRYGTVL